MIKIKFLPSQSTRGKLADAELHFIDGPLAGMKVGGIGVWKSATAGRSIRLIDVRSSRIASPFRPIQGRGIPQLLRQRLLDAYAAYEKGAERQNPANANHLIAVWEDDSTTLDDKLLETFRELSDQDVLSGIEPLDLPESNAFRRK